MEKFENAVHCYIFEQKLRWLKEKLVSLSKSWYLFLNTSICFFINEGAYNSIVILAYYRIVYSPCCFAPSFEYFCVCKGRRIGLTPDVEDQSRIVLCSLLDNFAKRRNDSWLNFRM